MFDVINDQNEVNKQQIIQIGQFHLDKPIADRRILKNTPRIKSFLDRSAYIAQIDKLLNNGNRIVVIHGKSGHGKRSLATLYFQAKEAAYEQIGWIDYDQGIRSSLVGSFHSYVTDAVGKMMPNLYRELAEKELNDLENHPVKRLLVISKVTNWEDVISFISLLQIKHTDYLITAEEPLPPELYDGYDLPVYNYPVPLLSPDQVQQVIRAYAQEKLTPERYQSIKGNLMLYNLIQRQAKTDNPAALRDYLKRIMGPEDDEEDVLYNIIAEDTLTGPEMWLLLQFAALPENGQQVNQLEELFFFYDYDNTPEDLTGLAGYQVFQNNYENFAPYATDNSLVHTLNSLVTGGWLMKSYDGHYTLHNLLRPALEDWFHQAEDADQGLPVGIFQELANQLEISYNQADASPGFKDTLRYRQHLQAFLDFVPGQPNDGYLEVLWKMITIVEGLGKYEVELNLREQHLSLFQQKSEVDLSTLVHIELDYQYSLLQNGELKESIVIGKEIVQKCSSLSASDGALIAEQYIAEAQNALGKHQVALDTFFSILKETIKYVSLDSYKIASIYHSIGKTYKYLDNAEDALRWLEKAKKIEESIFPDDHIELSNTYNVIGTVHGGNGDFKEGLKWCEKALKIQKENLEVGHPELLKTKRGIAFLKAHLGDTVTAISELKDVIQQLKKVLPGKHPSIAFAQGELGYSYYLAGQPERASVELNIAIDTLEESSMSTHVDVVYVKKILDRLEKAK